jgi:hypothetical protein
MLPEHQAHQQSLFLAANKATTHDIVASTLVEQRRFWLTWLSYLHQNFPSVCPYLQNLSHCQINVLMGAYATYICRGNSDGLGVKRSRWHYEPSERSVHWSENGIQWSHRQGNIIYPLPEFLTPSNMKTLRRGHN